jgi:hypothetical protein
MVVSQQQQLLREVGDPNGSIAPVLGLIWDLYNDKGRVNWQIQYNYAKRAALDIRLKEEQPDVDYAVGVSKDLEAKTSQEFDHLQTMREDCCAEIVRIEALVRAQRPAAVGALTKTAPESPPWGSTPNANSPEYQGDPYTGWPFRR